MSLSFRGKVYTNHKGEIYVMNKISIIIPVYNVEEYLVQCLDSVLQQTLKDIEVICIDDNSLDSSLEILNRYKNNDSRVKVFHFDKSKSALQARKLGVLNANGKYIMFLDADDYLDLNACEKLYNKIEKENVDILHFSSKVINCANISQNRVDYNQKIITPFEGKLEGPNVFNGCFIDNKYMITLWNKIFNAQLCKKAFNDMEDKYLPKAQDLYSFFVIAYYANSYLGWISEPLHYYCFGRGVTGTNRMDLNKFDRYCTQSLIVTELEAFSIKRNILDRTKVVLDKYYNNWINECINIWKNELPDEFSNEGLNILYKYWGEKEIVSRLSYLYWKESISIAKKLKNIKHISLKEKKVKRIGLYYYHFTIGGVQKVLSLLAPMFKEMGYEVVLIFDKEATENDMILPAGIERVNIFNRDNVKNDNFFKRIDSWNEMIDNYHLDLVLYNGWTSSLLLWDMLYLKSRGIPVFVHAHSVFSFSINKLTKSFAYLPKVFRLADGMIVLSEADKLFWSAYNENVHCIPNPIDNSLNCVNQVKFSNKSLVWVGRVSEEKQPEAIFEIMQRVVNQVPDARLYLLGNFDDEKWNILVNERGLTNNIQFCGMIHNVNEYFEKASIHFSTSKYEGFPMTLLEAQAHGLPTVMFDMCYLTLAQEGHGVVSIEMLNYNNAADEIVKLLTDEKHWEQYSNEAKNSYIALKEYDYKTIWKAVLDGDISNVEMSKETRQMIYTIVNHYEEGIRYRVKLDKAKKRRKKKRGLAKLINLFVRGINYMNKNGIIMLITKFFEKLNVFIKRNLNKRKI